MCVGLTILKYSGAFHKRTPKMSSLCGRLRNHRGFIAWFRMQKCIRKPKTLYLSRVTIDKPLVIRKVQTLSSHKACEEFREQFDAHMWGRIIWSGRLWKVKTIDNFQPTALKWSQSPTRGSNLSDFTRKRLLFWKSGPLRKVVACA